MARHSNPIPRASGFGIFWTAPKTGTVVPCEAYTVDAEGNTTSGDGEPAETLAAAYKDGRPFLTYEGYACQREALRRARELGAGYSVRALPAGTLFYSGETLCAVAPPKTDPADYARNHWRKFESDAEHAERVEAAEREAGRYFADATKPQAKTFNDTMSYLREFIGPACGPIWDRRRALAKAVWNDSTAGARALFEITADEIMRDGEVSEETSLAWDALTEQQTAPPCPELTPA